MLTGPLLTHLWSSARYLACITAFMNTTEWIQIPHSWQSLIDNSESEILIR